MLYWLVTFAGYGISLDVSSGIYLFIFRNRTIIYYYLLLCGPVWCVPLASTDRQTVSGARLFTIHINLFIYIYFADF